MYGTRVELGNQCAMFGNTFGEKNSWRTYWHFVVKNQGTASNVSAVRELNTLGLLACGTDALEKRHEYGSFVCFQGWLWFIYILLRHCPESTNSTYSFSCYTLALTFLQLFSLIILFDRFLQLFSPIILFDSTTMIRRVGLFWQIPEHSGSFFLVV